MPYAINVKRMITALVVASMILMANVTAAINVDGASMPDGRELSEIVAGLPEVDIEMEMTAPSIVAAERSKQTMFDKKSTPLAGLLYTMMIVDTKSTYDSDAWCPTCVETNPFAAPFVKAGKPAAYSAGIAFDTGVLYLAHKMRNSWNPAIRRIWFVLPVSLAIGHAFAIHHNYKTIKQK